MGKGEFERIADYFAPLAAGYPGAFNLTDDAALISPDAGQSLIVTTDTIVEGVHYIGDEPADMIARKLLRVSLSDLAGMGAKARELAQRRFDWSEIGGDLEALYRSVSEPLAKAA